MKRYEHCGIRLENRGNCPPTKEYVDELVKTLQSTGIEASWHSAVGYRGRPLFPSKIIPNCHPDANVEIFKYLTDSLHKIGRPVVSWYPLNLCEALTEAHPDWAMKFYEINGEKADPAFEKSYCCFNSPYGKMLPELAVEILSECGFDGLWFDGSTMSMHEGRSLFLPGCKCDFCRDRFGKDTGLALPEKIDFDDRNCRLWINWRYDVLMGVWRSIVDSVNKHKSDAAVCFNNYRRRHMMNFCWTMAIPLQELDMDMLMSGELDNFCHQADFQMKMHHAYKCKRGVESWWPLTDHWNNGPEVEALPGIQVVLGAIAAGGSISTGYPYNPALVKETLISMSNAANKAVQYIGGEPVEYAAILCSQSSQDFIGMNDPQLFWDQWHGANEACLQSHVQSSIIFDDSIKYENLKKYPLLVIGEAICLSNDQAMQLETYVEEGGCLLACGRVGQCDELGFAREKPVLDGLLGIKNRKPGQGAPTLKITDPELQQYCGSWVTISFGKWYTDVPVVLAEPINDVEMLGQIIDRPNSCTPRSYNWDEEWHDMSQKIKVPAPIFPGLWLRQFGKGKVVYCGAELFKCYLSAPTPHFLQLIKGLLNMLATPAIELNAPMCVRMNCRTQGVGEIAIHLHNAPGSTYRYPTPYGTNYIHSPGEVVPVSDIDIKFNKFKVKSARSALTGIDFEVSDASDLIRIPKLDLYDVVIVAPR